MADQSILHLELTFERKLLFDQHLENHFMLLFAGQEMHECFNFKDNLCIQ